MQFRSLEEIRRYCETAKSRLSRATYPHFHYVLAQIWHTLNAIPEIKTILDESQRGQYDDWNRFREKQPGQAQPFRIPIDEDRHFLQCVSVIRACLELNYGQQEQHDNEIDVGRWIRPAYTPSGKPNSIDVEEKAAQLSVFYLYIVEPLFDQIDRRLEGRSTMLGLLKRYKNKVEVFGRSDITRRIAAANVPETGAKLHLFEYLHDNRVVYFIEPTVGEGEPDLVAGQGTDDPLIADGKLFNGRADSILRGFHQVYKYLQRFNESVGYLIVFNQLEGDIDIHSDGIHAHVPYFVHNGKTIYFVIIDTFPEPTVPSKLGTLKSYRIDKTRIVKAIDEKPDDSNDVAAQ